MIAAMGRARKRLLVTAVDSEDGDESMLPSPFCYEMSRPGDRSRPGRARTDPRAPGAVPAALVGRLRAVVCAAPDAVDDAVRVCAATQLARLAQSGVPVPTRPTGTA